MTFLSNEENCDSIPADIVRLWQSADDLWEEKQQLLSFASYASADYTEVYQALKKLRGSAGTFLELGSGLGVVTIMASQLGFDAYGIEAEDELVDYSREFAEQYAENAKFATGSFIPDEFEWGPEKGESVRTFVDVPDAYDQFDLELEDFDLIYAYPWPTEHSLYDNVLSQFARPGASFLTYDAREGIGLETI
jgi:SAM-dependent methyltransferase